jgi:hypothetical protein
MKKVIFLSFALFMLMGSFIANAQNAKKQEAKKAITPKVEVYYFHFSQRCATCHAVEDNSKLAVTSLYPEQVKAGEYTFKGVNLDEATSKSIAEKLSIGGQTLLVISGDKKIDITTKAFLYAHDPIKIKAEIKMAIEKVLTR